jgi:hypothetical protein
MRPAARSASGRPGVGITAPLEVSSRGADWLAAWDQIWHWSI